MELKEKIIGEIKKIYDPEIPVNIYDLGLIYDVKVDDKNNVDVKMTLTTPNCPAAESLPQASITSSQVLGRSVIPTEAISSLL